MRHSTNTKLSSDLVSGTFTLHFGWAEGNIDTGTKQQDVADFAEELYAFLSERGAWDVDLYGPDSDRMTPSSMA